MKKYLSLIIIIMLFGFMFIPNVFADNKVFIKSIELVEKSENTTINSEPKFNNLVMDFDIAFKAQDDFVKYKVVVSNNTNVDYKISEDTSFNESQYMTYKYDVENELKSNDETIVYVTITYSKTIDSSKLSNGKYSESNKAIVQLLDEEGTLVNPNTSSSIVMILINLCIVLFVSLLLFIKSRNKNIISLVLILGLSLIPITTYAVETLKLTINVNVEIEKGYRVAYYTGLGVYLTDEELKDWDMSNTICYGIFNVNDGLNTKKYTYCNRGIYIDSKIYLAGERVDLKGFERRYIQLGGYDSNMNWDEYCIADSNDNNVFTCDSRVEENIQTPDYWWYDKEYSNKYNYPVFDSDIDVMNFSSASTNSWTKYNYVNFELPVSFTMPDHDVLFETFPM